MTLINQYGLILTTRYLLTLDRCDDELNQVVILLLAVGLLRQSLPKRY